MWLKLQKKTKKLLLKANLPSSLCTVQELHCGLLCSPTFDPFDLWPFSPFPLTFDPFDLPIHFFLIPLSIPIFQDYGSLPFPYFQTYPIFLFISVPWPYSFTQPVPFPVFCYPFFLFFSCLWLVFSNSPLNFWPQVNSWQLCLSPCFLIPLCFVFLDITCSPTIIYALTGYWAVTFSIHFCLGLQFLCVSARSSSLQSFDIFWYIFGSPDSPDFRTPPPNLHVWLCFSTAVLLSLPSSQYMPLMDSPPWILHLQLVQLRLLTVVPVL